MTGPSTRRFLFPLVLGLLCCAVMELISLVGLSWMVGGWLSSAERQAERVRAGIGSGATEVDEDAFRGVRSQGGEVLHPFLGFVRDPALESNSRWGMLNTEGFFEIEEEQFRPRSGENVFRIAVFGGSVADQFARVGTPALIATLRADPLFQGKGFSVSDFALGGYKQPQQVLALAYFSSQIERFDLVINLDGFNEIALSTFNYFTNKQHPFYPRDWIKRVEGLPGSEDQLRIGEIAFSNQRRVSLSRLCSWGPLRHSATCHLVWKVLDRRPSTRVAALRESLSSSAAGGGGGFLGKGPEFPEVSLEELLPMQIIQCKKFFLHNQ